MEIQNNLNKAIEIRLDYTKGGYKETIYAADLEDALKEMAEWKDKQLKEQRRIIRKHWQEWAEEQKQQWIEKTCKFLENRNILEKDCSILASGICSITFHPDNLINDLKQAMEE